MSESEYLEAVPQAEPPAPVESALGILLRRPPGATEILFGRRSARTGFLPGHLAFPGGRLDDADEVDRHGAHERCASREVGEEVGVRIAPETWVPAGERTTPPMFPVRFHTRFFLAELPAGAGLPAEPPAPREIDLVRFATAATVLGEWERGECLVPPPCLPILRDLAASPSDEPIGRLGERLREVNRLEERCPRIEFVPGIWVVPVRTPTIPPATHTNVWMPGGDRFAIVDPGSEDPAEIERLLGVIGRRRALGARPDSILLTHHHPDHVAGAPELARALGLPVRAHPQVLDGLGPRVGAPEPRPLADGDVVDLGGLTLRVVHAPGHAPGHLVFEVPERGVVITGDLVSGFSTILIDPHEGDMAQYVASLRRVRGLGPRRLLPAHGPPLPGEAADHVIRHRLERESRIREGLSPDEWRSVAQVAGEAYRDTPGAPAALSEGQTLAHLLDLARRGLARRHPEEGSLWALVPDPPRSRQRS
jgi:glyoxylase-like metal-dependent hydrolase (beta-lactamase superfamily II)/8-oxo-dGTP pyrophosphatase MutT (NUDIX family)